jgi:uncharacterized membrane protein
MAWIILGVAHIVASVVLVLTNYPDPWAIVAQLVGGILEIVVALYILEV